MVAEAFLSEASSRRLSPVLFTQEGRRRGEKSMCNGVDFAAERRRIIIAATRTRARRAGRALSRPIAGRYGALALRNNIGRAKITKAARS